MAWFIPDVKVKTTETVEEESSNTMIFGGIFVFGILAAAYIYRNYSDFDDEYASERDFNDKVRTRMKNANLLLNLNHQMHNFEQSFYMHF